MLRQFHNWIKTSIISTYCSEFKINKNGTKQRTRVLDLGIGRGGDIMKYYHARVMECVGIEPSYADIFGALDSASIRYNQNKVKNPGFTKFILIQGDAKLPLESKAQEKKLTNMTPANKELIDQTFTAKRQFDVISIQFALHYIFDTKQSVDNLINTVTRYLKVDGYFICTLFDADQVIKLLGGKDVFTSHYTTDDGQRSKFFEIIKRFEGNIKDEPGQSIDVHMDWISEENIYIMEYLVTSRLLLDTMKKANCVLVDSDLFANTYQINKGWMQQVTQTEHNPKNKESYDKLTGFYGNLKDADKESKVWNDLFRYYVFKKI
jgi:SAM-dependent methyltransferase